MHKLSVYQSQFPLFLEADLTTEGSLFVFHYRMQPHGTEILHLPSEPMSVSASQIERLDNLWTTTCFEAFLQPEGSPSYFELNFSLKPAWNAYEFERYREPQPPQKSSSFCFQGLQWDPHSHTLRVEVLSSLEQGSWKVGLTAVIEDMHRTKYYYALSHPSARADFHASDSFLLSRGSNT